MDKNQKALNAHKLWNGKVEVISRCKVNTKEDLATAYTPGVAAPCLEIEKNKDLSYTYTRKGNMVAVISDGSAVLGLGNIGPEASMPVMEGKCVLFKEFAGVDAFPLCITTQDTEEIIKTIYNISKSFGGINLEDISAPRCFEIEKRLKEICDIPVFHDDQHGTAIVVAAGLLNALKLKKIPLENARIVINGAGSAGISIANHLLTMGAKDITMVDLKGIIAKENSWQNHAQNDMAKITNIRNLKGGLGQAMKDSDVFIGVSAPNVVTKEMVESMAENPVLFAMANPVPEIMPDKALEYGAYIVGTGRSDFPNQINNVLAFPGIFKGALSVRASRINEEMKIAASFAIADMICEKDLRPDYIIPSALDKNVAENVAKAVADAAVKTKVSRI